MKLFTKKGIRYSILGLLLLAVLLFMAGAFSGVLTKGRIKYDPVLLEAAKDLNSFDIAVEFDPEAKALQCIQRLKYTNRTGGDMTHLYFHLYPNAFRYEEKPVFSKDEMRRAYPNGFSPGFIEIERLEVDGSQADYIIGGYSEDLLMLLVKGSLGDGASMNIEMQYTVQLPDSMGRFGYGENTYKAANWYPIPCVYDETGWNLDRYYPIGDPFYSEAANYNITIKAPADYVVAATGDIADKKTKDNATEWNIKAKAVRDFAWLASDKFKISSDTVGSTTVYSYYFTDKTGVKALDYAASALKHYNTVFGRYPYNQFSVVESDFFIGGMEYPNLIMVDHSLYTYPSEDWLELVTVHETAHQWWYGLVGNNQIRDAWIDEGLTEYSTVLYYGLRYGDEKEEEIYKTEIAEGKYSSLQYYVRTTGIDESIHRPSYAFSDWVIYDLLVYGKGAMMFHELKEQIGEESFYGALQNYYEEFKFKNVKKEDLINIFDKTTGQSWENYFNKWLNGEKGE